MKLLFDDLRFPGDYSVGIKIPNDCKVVRTLREAKKFLQDNVVDELYLDHDLGCPFTTGYDLLVWLEQPENRRHLPGNTYLVTSNPSARKKMDVTLFKLYANREENKPLTSQDKIERTVDAFENAFTDSQL